MPMNGVLTSAALGLLAAATIHSLPVGAQQQPAPPLVQQLNHGNWLPQRRHCAMSFTTSVAFMPT